MMHISRSICHKHVGLCSCAATDWRFAFTREGKNVPFATAGDCYSAARCPQVRPTTAVHCMAGGEFFTATVCITMLGNV